MQRQTLAGLLAGKDQPLKERIDWGKMRMDPTDVADVNGSTYTFLVNGHGPRDNWTALFSPGERVRLRIVNASAMTIFNVRIPGLRMTVVQADGLNVVPTEIDEFQIAVAETYDVIVTPVEDRAYTLVAEANDRSGMGRATLAPRAGMVAEVPPLRERPLATMKDMGMGDMSGGAMAGMDHSGGDMGAMPMPASDPSCPPEHAKMGHCTPAGESGAMAGMDHGSGGGMQHSMRDFSVAPQVKRDPSVQTISPMPMDRMGEPGQGLENVGHKVLNYHDLVALERNPDTRAASRSLDIHLTGNMERFMWSFDGIKMSDYHEPIPFIEGERVRINLINDSMMSHPIHLHGHFFELVTGKGDRSPRKHTVLVQPGGIASFDFTADALGDWAFHCHLLYHMHAGMMRVVSVRPKGDGE
jgi:CopA family copper-resistance protein